MPSPLYEALITKNPDLQERFALGKSIRKQVVRSSLAEFNVTAKRQTPIEILHEQAKTRIQEYVPIRHARMAVADAALVACALQQTRALVAGPEFFNYLQFDRNDFFISMNESNNFRMLEVDNWNGSATCLSDVLHASLWPHL